ncbi:hypothetical protein C5167_018838 [Papaver somniferum]|uniref:Uncharacterized protein n=1 Tax=Papaver somniferum TaxID=3469 RepID=A0A4Y7IQK6_PAPSO|nr:hypothetical protein C5167_018838 [Papaver somniferum]
MMGTDLEIVLPSTFTGSPRCKGIPDLFLKELMKSLSEKKHFGTVSDIYNRVSKRRISTCTYPLLLWSDKKDKPQTPSEIDRIISAEIPDKEKDPDGRKAVVRFMLHGPCRISKPYQKCTRDNKCSKHYPKAFNIHATMDENGYPFYRRRKNNVYAHKDGVDFSNQWVIPHNRDMTVQFDVHINVEVCNGRGSLVKYIFKYIHKGRDRLNGCH